MSLPVAELAVASVVVNIVGVFPYIRDILMGKTKPERATWWIWSALITIAFLAQLASGATWSLLFTGVQLVGVGATAVLSLKYGHGRFQTKDFVALLVALFGIILWKQTHQPLAALLIIIGIDAIGYVLLAEKTWKSPQTETLISWGLSAVAALLGVLSVDSYNFAKLVYPAYVLAGDVIIVLVIIGRRKALAANRTDL